MLKLSASDNVKICSTDTLVLVGHGFQLRLGDHCVSHWVDTDIQTKQTNL